MKTEAQARKCWCPFAMTFGRLIHHRDSEPVGTSYGPQNRGTTMGGKLDTCLCIASECMVWRWDPDELNSAMDHPESGFCGLAGKS